MTAASRAAGRLPALLLAVALAVGGAVGALVGIPVVDPAGGAPTARAAETDLTLVTAAQYTVDPANARVQVSVDITATNRRPETTTRRFYFDRAFLAVQPGVENVRISGASGPAVSISQRTATFTMLRISFGQRLYSARSFTFRLTFDLPDAGGAADRDVRVGDSLVTFPVWAFASDGASGSTVAVTFPPGYEVSLEAGALPDRTTAADGSTTLRSGPIAQPLSFFAFAVGEREGSTADVTVAATVAGEEVEVVLRAWADDPAWAERVGGLFRDGLPVLATDIGLPWRLEAPLVVEETRSRAEGGYAGLFEPAAGRMEVAYWAPPGVVLQEAAHAWFNGSLLADRWANEGFAAYYAGRAAGALEVAIAAPELTEELEAAAIPLNAWGPRGEDEASVEAYGYAASLRLATLVAERVGDAALRNAWKMAAGGIAAYPDPARPGAFPEADGPPDWRGLLDLLEEASGEDLGDLWRTWVVRDDEEALLDARAAARVSLARTEVLAGDWAVPPQAREALRAWQFEVAEQVLADARTVLAQRGAVAAAADAAGLEAPDMIRAPFERGDLVAASSVAATQFSAIQVLAGAAAYRPAAPDPLTAIGLLGEQPDALLAEGHAAFARGDVDTALARASAAQATWTGAWEEGRRRALFAVAIIAALALLVAAAAGRLRTRRAARAVAGAGAGPGAGSGDADAGPGDADLALPDGAPIGDDAGAARRGTP